MTRKLLAAMLCMAATAPIAAQDKAVERLAESTAVLKTIMEKQGIPPTLMDKAACVLVYPGVRKVGVAVGVTRGRGVITCRTGEGMKGGFGAPAMYTLDAGSVGLQLGTSETDYVLLVMTDRGASKVLQGKMKLGADATAIAGPNGAKAAGWNDPNTDILAYSQEKGLFAGASISGVSMESDNDMNKELYGKEITATAIVRNATPVPAGAKELIGVLNKLSPTRK